MNKMKYIIVDNGMYAAPIIFDGATDHSAMAAAVHGKVVSAGFIRFTPKGLECYGDSFSLGIASRPEEDTEMINNLLGVQDDWEPYDD